MREQKWVPAACELQPGELWPCRGWTSSGQGWELQPWEALLCKGQEGFIAALCSFSPHCFTLALAPVWDEDLGVWKLRWNGLFVFFFIAVSAYHCVIGRSCYCFGFDCLNNSCRIRSSLCFFPDLPLENTGSSNFTPSPQTTSKSSLSGKRNWKKGLYIHWCSSKHQFWLQPHRWVWLLGVHPPLPVISCEFTVIIIHTQNPTTLSY